MRLSNKQDITTKSKVTERSRIDFYLIFKGFSTLLNDWRLLIYLEINFAGQPNY